MAGYQIVYLLCIPFIIAAEYFFTRTPLGQSRHDRWLVNASLGFINEALLLASPVWLPLVIPTSAPALLPPLVGVLLTFLLLDLALYWIHRAYHGWGLLWRLHRVHHCDLDLDFTTSFRHHPVEVLATLLVISVLMKGLALDPVQVIPYLVTARLVQLLAHANIRLGDRTTRLVRRLLVTPDVHQIHHSSQQQQTDSNFGEVLTIWDRLFGTYTSPATLPEPPQVGLSQFRSVGDQRLGALLGLPLR